MVNEYITQVVSMDIQDLRKENENLELEVENLEKELFHLPETEAYENNVMLLVNDQVLLKQELQNVKNMTATLIKELNDWDGSVQKPVKHYKDIKLAIEKHSLMRSDIQKTLAQIESNSVDMDTSSRLLAEDVAASIAKNKEELRSVKEESKGAILNLQAQLKLIEARKKTLQFQLQQKNDENKELTKICEELINQRQTSPDDH